MSIRGGSMEKDRGFMDQEPRGAGAQVHTDKQPDLKLVPFELKQVRIRTPQEIPHRQWILGSYLIRSYVTLLAAPGATGKSSLLLAWCMGIAIGRSLVGGHLYQQCNTAFLNLEDPEDEMDRRVAAIARHYNISDEDIRGRFFMSPADRRVTIAAQSSEGYMIWHPDEDAIIERLKADNIGLLAVDPFAESHTLEENSNPQMIQAAAAWRRVARKCNCALALAHHFRKGPTDGIDSARGAKALTDSARIGLVMSVMNEQEAATLGISAEERFRYVRLDDAKMNLAPRAGRATWMHLNHVELENAGGVYASGDHVVVIEPWRSPGLWDRFTFEQLNAVLDQIASGMPNGVRYSHTKQSGERWAGTILLDQLDVTADQAGEMLRQWMANGVVTKTTYRDPVQRKDRVGLFVDDSKRPGMEPG